jgi:riboflavin kinase/FMN adenylyltransferase
MSERRMTAQIVYGIEHLPHDSAASVVTIGKFDGVHRGHRAVLDQLRGEAHGRRTVVVTFDRHPAAVLHPGSAPEPLLSVAQKTEALAAAEVDLVVVLPFTAEFARQSADSFVKRVLVDGLNAQHVMVGSDFRYGAHGSGTLDTLRAAGEREGFTVALVGDVRELDGTRVSSTGIRRLLAEGHLDEATEALGRPHRIRSLVVRGHQRGRELGYPTANLARDAEGYIPADGVYACWLHADGVRYGAAVSVGNNPTFGDVPEKTVEAHAIDAHLDLYGVIVELEFVEYIRPMNKFSSTEALAGQMRDDEQRIRTVLGLPSTA